MKKVIIILICLIILGVAGFFVFKSKKQEPKFKTEPVVKTDIIETVTASGTVNPVTSISVGTQVSGTIKTIYVDYNSPVKKGQLLAQIDPALFESQVAQARANVYSARANLQKVLSIVENDLKTYNRTKNLYAQDYIAKSEVDLAESTYKSNLAQVEAAKAQIAQAEAVLRNNLTNLRYTRIVSPVDGIVISRNVDVGQTVAASFQTPTLFLVAQDLTKMQIDTNVAEADIGKVKEGQDVEYTLDGYPDLVFKGKVKQIRIAPNADQNVVTYNVVINVDNKDMKLKPGMTANVSIITAKKENVIAVPNASLKFTPFEGENAPKFKKQGIWVLENGKPKRIDITTGLSNSEYTEITSNNLSENQLVIVDKLGKPKKMKQSGPPRMRMF